MADRWDRATRSRVMASVRTRDTKPERVLRAALSAAGVRGYRLHRKDVPGTPDLAWLGRRLAVFVDGAFWHGHPSAFTPGNSGAFWDQKISANMERDERVRGELEASGWSVIRMWDFDVFEDPERCVQRIINALARTVPR